MRSNHCAGMNSRTFTLTTMFIAVLCVFSIFAAPAAFGQLDKLKKAIKKVENEVDKQADKTKQTNPSPARTPAENNPAPTPATTTSTSSGQTSAARQNANKNKRLVFSNQPIDPNDPANLKTSFQAGEHIYGLLILDVPFKDFIEEEYLHDRDYGYSITRPALEFDMLVDGKYDFHNTHYFVFSRDDKQNAWNQVPTERYFFFDIAPDPAKQKTYGYKSLSFKSLSVAAAGVRYLKAGAQYNSYTLAKLQPGSHTVVFKIKGKEEIVGEFSISGSDYALYDKVADNLEIAAASNTMLPKPQWSDAETINSIKKAYKPRGSETILRINLMGAGWFIQKNALGQILFRGIHASVATKSSEGRCYYQNEYFKQDYSGGRYGATYQDGRSERRQLLPCENVMK